MKQFGSKEICKCLKKLGFTSQFQRASSHIKYKPPIGKNRSLDQRPFQMVQLGKKTFSRHACARYTSQIKSFGFTKKEIVDNL